MPELSPEERQYPVIVVPGILGTTLVDEYPIGEETVWNSPFSENHERISLHPDNLNYESKEPARISSRRFFEITYKDLILALRHELSASADLPTPVYAFSYDWRKDVQKSAVDLDAFVEEVIERTKLLKHYAGWFEKKPKVNLVGHSMGGLVICEYLAQFGTKRRCKKITTMCTPYQGSIEAIAKLLTGIGYLSGKQPKERERESARTFQSVYQLLPSFNDAVVNVDTQKQVNLYEASSWQTSMIESLAEYVRLHSVTGSVERGGRDNLGQATAIFNSMLKNAEDHRKKIYNFSKYAKESGVNPTDWLVIVGAGGKTRLSVEVTSHNGSPWFGVMESDFVDRWRDDRNSWDTGDNTVPLRGALPPFLDPSRLVVLSPEDFGWLEVGDNALLLFAGFHAQIPNLNLAQRLVIKHLKPSYGGKIWARRIPGVKDWQPPIEELLKNEKR